MTHCWCVLALVDCALVYCCGLYSRASVTTTISFDIHITLVQRKPMEGYSGKFRRARCSRVRRKLCTYTIHLSHCSLLQVTSCTAALL